MLININKLKNISIEEMMESRKKKQYYIVANFNVMYGDYESNYEGNAQSIIEAEEKAGNIIITSYGLHHYAFITYVKNNNSNVAQSFKTTDVSMQQQHGYALIIASNDSYTVVDDSVMNGYFKADLNYNEKPTSKEALQYVGELLIMSKTARVSKLSALKKQARRIHKNFPMNKDLNVIFSINPNEDEQNEPIQWMMKYWD